MAFHIPVMCEEVIENLVINKDGAYLDSTIGGGGHTEAILKKLGPAASMIGLDRDMEAVERNQKKFAGDPRVTILHGCFSDLPRVLGARKLTGALFDLGVSSHQLDTPSRGFSFEPGCPLDMRMDRSRPGGGREYLASVPTRELAATLSQNADLKRAGRLATAIKTALSSSQTSDAIRQALDSVYPGGLKNRPGVLARIFQAVRMEVNNELNEITAGLRAVVDRLKPGGRVCVLSYHSVEDRQVKRAIAELEKDCRCPAVFPICNCGGGRRRLSRVYKKPLVSGPQEVARNARARSAKLRVAARVFQTEGGK